MPSSHIPFQSTVIFEQYIVVASSTKEQKLRFFKMQSSHGEPLFVPKANFRIFYHSQKLPSEGPGGCGVPPLPSQGKPRVWSSTRKYCKSMCVLSHIRTPRENITT